MVHHFDIKVVVVMVAFLYLISSLDILNTQLSSKFDEKDLNFLN